MANMDDSLLVAPAAGGFGTTLNTTDTEVDGGAVLAKGWWKFSADTDYRIAAAQTTKPATAAGSRRQWAKENVLLYSDGNLRVVMEAVTSAGNYTADLVHPG